MNHLWYYRRAHRIVGPVPLQAIERYVILGRLSLNDEVRKDASPWIRIRECPEFESTKKLVLYADDQKLAAMRRFSDERSQERRSESVEQENDIRRRDRRTDEPEDVKELRNQRSVVFEPQRARTWMVYLFVAGIIGVVLMAVYFYQPVNPIRIVIPGR
ncbi:MAG TPA: hypothetical protein PLK99_08990 [Burkholderiales bacterium]|nr:hypothetical protein [Burkholderiales bacterium]